MRKQQALDRIGETIPHIKWTDLSATKDCQMSVGQEGKLSDERLSLKTESKNKDVFLVSQQEQTEVAKDYSKQNSVRSEQNSPKYESDSNQTSPLENQTAGKKNLTFDENTRSLPTNMQLIPKIESDNARTEFCEVTTKATNIDKISTNDLLEIKVQRQSILNKGFHNDKLSSPPGGNHTSKELCTNNKMHVVDVAHARESKLGMDIIANKQLEYGKYCIEDYKTQILCNVREERFDFGRNTAMTSTGDSLGQNEDEVLDLSLPKKKDRSKKRQSEWVVDPEYEGSLHMEVDEIEDEPQHVEVEQEDDNEISWIPLVSEAHAYLPQYWDGQLSSTALEAMPNPSYPTIITPDPMDTLLIDDQGIPYTLAPDGQKVPQIDNIQHAEGLCEQTALSPRQAEDKPSSFADVQDIEDSRLQTQPNSLCPNTSLGHISVEESQDAPNLESKSSYSSVAHDKPSTIPAVSDLASVPIQIVANTTGSNTPILLLPPSQLQSLSSSASKANPGLITLSLPIPLSQNTQSSPMFLVLSSPQVSSTQSSSSSGQLSHISPSSSVALPLATCPLDMGSTLSSRPSLLSLSTVSTAKDISGLNNPSNLPASPTSSTASSSTSTVTSTSPTKQSSTDAYSDTPVPTSFREALLRLAVSVEKKQESQHEMHSVATASSCSETTKSDSSAAVHESKNPETEVNCDGETESTSVDQTDTLDTISSTSPLRSISPVNPINHQKNQDSQALGPRRILYCQYCPRVFYYLSDLERHSITHSQNKPHVCHLCGKAFKRSSHLERHKHIHTGQRNFVCQLCPRRFRESGELMRHQRVHTGEKPFQCLICHMRFAERNTLRRHTKRKHQGQHLEAMDMKVKPESGGISLSSVQEESEENAEWYSSTVPEMESDSDTGGE
ncbi:B-cell lymphoma 6 protein homolog [Pseudorasbora parva]|uniref:B-cell lymphoma 6 protein homolog n=1 Tax=Pseudorasbora parva TaxID=51549 RepID=UPI00351E59B7